MAWGPYGFVSSTRHEFWPNGSFGGGVVPPPQPYLISAIELNAADTDPPPLDFVSKDGDLSGLPATASNVLMFIWANHRFFTTLQQTYFASEGNYQVVTRGPVSSLNTANIFLLDDFAGYIAANGSQSILPNMWNMYALSCNISDIISPVLQSLLNNTLDPSVLLDNELTSNKFKLGPYANWSIGAGESGADKMGGDIAMFYLNYSNTFFDLSIEANRRKIITADGKPVNPGIDGSLVTGTAPQVFMVQNFGDSDPNNFAINYGNGGTTPPIFFMNGSPTIAPSSPSD